MPGDGLCDICFSPDGTTARCGKTNGDVSLIDVATRQVIRTVHGHTNSVYGLDFSPDGRRLATGSGDTTVRIWNVETGNALIILDKPTSYVWDVKFTPDGTALFAADGQRRYVRDSRLASCYTATG